MLFLLLFIPPLSATQPCGTVTLAWDGNANDSSLAGYVVYYGSSPGHYTGRADVMLSTTATLPNIVPGLTYYFTVTAYNTSGAESDPSNEIAYQVPLCNRAPVLSVPADCLTANVGEALVVTNVAVDLDFPPQALTFGVSAPFGADPWITTNGIFVWRPPLQFASSTHFFDISVTDNGTPPLTHSQTLCVAVNDYVLVQLGTVVVRRGQSTNVLLEVFSTVPITDLCVTIQYPNAHLANLSLLQPNPLLCSTTITTISSNVVQACFRTCPGQALFQGANIAQLHFTTLPGPSAFVPLRLIDATAVRDDSQPIRHINRRDGRSVVIGNEPLLDIARGANSSLWLTLFGKPGATYDILNTPSTINHQPSTTLATVVLQNLSHQLRLTNSAAPLGLLSALETGGH